jgi:glycosyltransferase involved in cell wall biosynthesis
MRILITSHLFSPSVGGVEQVGGVLAEEFSALGHEVRVVTRTQGAAEDEPPASYRVVRLPGRVRLVALTLWADVVLQNNISLATLWPALLLGTPAVVTYQTWVTQPGGRIGWRERVKLLCVRGVWLNVAVSRALAASLPVACELIPNPYRENVFHPDPEVPRDRDLVMVGRLVSDKGADCLIDALSLLRARGLAPNLTIVGAGPEEDFLRRQAARAGLGPQIAFAGVVTGADLRRVLNRHRILVVPSRTPEPYGIVALEGAACGCGIVGSGQGGLPEAIGPCGVTYPNGDASALADAVARLLGDPQLLGRMVSAAPAHLAGHRRREVAEAYLGLLRRAAGTPRKP